jgi:hypothetical protein
VRRDIHADKERYAETSIQELWERVKKRGKGEMMYIFRHRMVRGKEQARIM